MALQDTDYRAQNDTEQDTDHRVQRILLRVAYDGTHYHGWQLQPNAITVEEVLNRALQELTGTEVKVIGTSRTDAGVHALGNVAVFDTVSRIPAEKFSYALNQRLPNDVVIQESVQVADDFHPRHCPCSKTYEYTILNRRFPLPEYRNTAYFEYGALDLDKMRAACKAFIGEHDFSGFCSSGAQVKSMVRMVYSLEVLEQEIITPVVQESRLITIRIRGNGFLYNMVRIIAGTLLEVGRGHIPPEDVAGIIASRDRGQAGPTAPAQGLKLVEIAFEE